MSEEEEVTEKKKLFSFLSRDRKVLEIGEVSQLPCFIFHFFSAAVVVHKSTSEALVQTKGSWKKKRRQGERKVRGGGGGDENEPPPPPPIERGLFDRKSVAVPRPSPRFDASLRLLRHLKRSQERLRRGWRKIRRSEEREKAPFPLEAAA